MTLITTLISLFSLIVTLLVVAPIISKCEERQYLALTFFMEITDEKRVKFMKECLEFNLFEENGPPAPARQLSVNSLTDSNTSNQLMREAEEELKRREFES